MKLRLERFVKGKATKIRTTKSKGETKMKLRLERFVCECCPRTFEKLLSKNDDLPHGWGVLRVDDSEFDSRFAHLCEVCLEGLITKTGTVVLECLKSLEDFEK